MKLDGEVFPLSRRRFLERVVQMIVLGGMSGCAMDFRQSETPPPPWFQQAVKYPDAARRFGQIYLTAYPAEASIAFLVRTIEAAMTGNNDSQQFQQPSLQALDKTIRREFQQAKTVSVQGWIVSQSEARFYALVALAAHGIKQGHDNKKT